MQSQKLEAGVWYDPSKQTDHLKSDNGSYNPYAIAKKTKIIDKLLIVAGKHNGRVFGGYVRDVIVPRLNNPTAKAHFSDVDIWFTKQEDADAFVSNTKLCLDFSNKKYTFSNNDNKSSNIKPGMMHYTFGRVQYRLYKEDKFISHFDIIVSETIPVDDFDVNCLTYQYMDNGLKVARFCSDELDYTEEEIIEQIKNKQAFMLSSYIPKLYIKNAYGQINYSYFVNRLNNKYLSRGWTISCLVNHKFPLSINEEWLTNVFASTAKLYFKSLKL